MERSLINPNRCKSFGIHICYDPKDPNKEMGLFTDNISIHLSMDGSTATMMTHTVGRN